MLLRLTLATVLASLALHAGTTLTVYLDAAPLPASETQREMEREFEALTASLSMDVRWQSYQDRRAAPATEYLLVVTLLGSCADNRNSGPTKTGDILASAAVSDGRVLPFVQINCQRVRSLMQTEMRGRTTREKHQILGRALARVLAHEAYHVIAESSDHERHGVAKSQLRAAELADESFSLDPASRSRMEEKLPSTRGDEELVR